MPKDKQWEWCVKNVKAAGESLADLAFRLRDEVVNNDLKNETGWWCEAEYEVFLYLGYPEEEEEDIGLDTWCCMYAEPIHWILAALIAKELAKGKDGKES